MTLQEAQAERIEKEIRELSRFSAEGPGVTRLTYTPEHAAARETLIAAMKAAALSVREDALGNIIGRREGTDPELPAIAVGSHFDSVRNGGMFDGTAGVVCALEAARVLQENGYVNRHPLEFIAIVEEEGARFSSGMLGGRAIAGLVADRELDSLVDEDGVSVRQAATAFGLKPGELQAAARSAADMRAFIELHIEQGPLLEQEQIEIGVVTSIVGVRALRVMVKGRSDHAGTTPMHLRQDALVPAALMVREVNRFVNEIADGTVATVGHLTVAPGGGNQVPGEVDFTLDLRSPHEESLRVLIDRISVMVGEVASQAGVAADVDEFFNLSPVQLAPTLVDAVREAASALEYTHRDISSGAGHDSMFIAQVTEVGMVFVPSRAGRSHVPEEWTDFDDLRKGTEVVLRVMKALDR
ncbi:M20 family metallo-hydrolase [Paenarthrobacter sp. A20]|uniref:M20 family metallo-hydrolase n=1 Tax=Paenarthrobacter sp. A20 TaxID=2817891 RepID=UPI00209ECB44|nr:M20 family metallo-hydrolase [Paenarthrobacter sp. A20]MCP1413788.1 allantoate deiminase [Paenarthrobacter sp. A20]